MHRLYRPTLGKGSRRAASLHLSHFRSTQKRNAAKGQQTESPGET